MPVYRCLDAACKAPFEARKADRDRGWALYCSKRCKAKHQTFLESQGTTLAKFLDCMKSSSSKPLPADPKHKVKRPRPAKIEAPKPEGYGGWA